MLYVKSLGDGENYKNSDEAAVNISFGGTTENGKNTYILTFSSATNSKGISSYTGSWYATIDGNKYNIANFNNNNNGWQYIKCGSKSAASIATISTDWAIVEAIEKVTVTIDAVTSTNVNSTYLEVATDSGFSNVIEKISVTIAKGDLVYAITNPTANCYYRLTYDCKKSSNGIIQISKVVYTNE